MRGEPGEKNRAVNDEVGGGLKIFHELNPRIVFNAVVFFGLFAVVPTVKRADEIQFCYRRAFYPAFCKSPCSSAYLFTRIAVRGAVSWVYYFKTYALPLTVASLRFGLSQGGSFSVSPIAANVLCFPPISESSPLNTALLSAVFIRLDGGGVFYFPVMRRMRSNFCPRAV